jgi:hypothetical protein
MRPPVDIEERLRRHAAVYRRDTEPSTGLHTAVVAGVTAIGVPRARSSFARNELAGAAAIVVFFGLLAFGFAKLHGASQSAKEALTPSASVIPWVATAPTPSSQAAPSAIAASPEQARALIARTVTGTTPVLLPAELPAGLTANVRSTATSIDVTYANAAGNRQVRLATVVPNPPPLGPNAALTFPPFRGGTASYQVDDRTQPAGRRLLGWVEHGIWNEDPLGGRGVPYLLSSTGLNEAEFWQVANSMTAIVPLAPLCRASDVEVALPGTHPLDGGNVVLTFLLRNRTGSSCSVSGVPGTRMQFGDGSEALLAAHYPSSAEVSRPDLVLPPSSVATAFVTAMAQGCSVTAHRSLRDAVLQLFGNAESVPVGVRKGNVTIEVCGTAQGAFDATGMGLLQEPSPTNKTVSPAMTARLATPARVGAGHTLLYLVTLTNRSTTPFVFSHCPSFMESLDSGQQTSGHYLLNCGREGVVIPGASVTFAMALDLPALTPPGRHTLTWVMDMPYLDTATQAPVTVTKP